MDSELLELQRVHVPRDSGVTREDIATISKLQALARGRVIRRQRKEQEAAVVAIQVSLLVASPSFPGCFIADSTLFVGCIPWPSGTQGVCAGRVFVQLRSTSDRQPQITLPIQRREPAAEKHPRADVQ